MSRNFIPSSEYVFRYKRLLKRQNSTSRIEFWSNLSPAINVESRGVAVNLGDRRTYVWSFVRVFASSSKPYVILFSQLSAKYKCENPRASVSVSLLSIDARDRHDFKIEPTSRAPRGARFSFPLEISKYLPTIWGHFRVTWCFSSPSRWRCASFVSVPCRISLVAGPTRGRKRAQTQIWPTCQCSSSAHVRVRVCVYTEDDVDRIGDPILARPVDVCTPLWHVKLCDDSTRLESSAQCYHIPRHPPFAFAYACA